MDVKKQARNDILGLSMSDVMSTAMQHKVSEKKIQKVRTKVLKLLDKHEIDQADAIFALGTIVIDVMSQGREESLKKGLKDDKETLQSVGGVNPIDAGHLRDTKGDS